jgi:hypothetical protein
VQAGTAISGQALQSRSGKQAVLQDRLAGIEIPAEEGIDRFGDDAGRAPFPPTESRSIT